MIKDERQHRIAKAQAARFRNALQELKLASRPTNVQPRLWEAQRAGLRSQLRDLEKELREYEELKAGGRDVLELDSLEEIPKALIQGRIAAGMTQEDLAVRLGVKPQQVQRYEATDYQSASFARVREVARVLALRVREQFQCPARRSPELTQIVFDHQPDASRIDSVVFVP